jgi:hypothetical protein
MSSSAAPSELAGAAQGGKIVVTGKASTHMAAATLRAAIASKKYFARALVLDIGFSIIERNGYSVYTAKQVRISIVHNGSHYAQYIAD